MTKEMILRGGKVALLDDEDYWWFSQWEWSAMTAKKTFYVNRSGRNLLGEKITILLHREILQVPKDMTVDHINGDGLDNRRSNLRLATRSENQRNRGKQSNNKSGYKGVYWDKRDKKWCPQIILNYKKVYLGQYDDLEEAARAYDEAAKKYYGEFARLNFPDT